MRERERLSTHNSKLEPARGGETGELASRSWPSTRALNTHIFSLLLARAAIPEASAASPTYSALFGWPSRARCPPPWPYFPGPGRLAPTRGAGFLGLTPAGPGGRPPREVPAYLALLPRPCRASCSLTRSFFLPPVAALGPDLAPLLAPSSPARRSGLATPPGKAPRFSVLHDPPRGRAKKGRLGWHTRTLFF